MGSRGEEIAPHPKRPQGCHQDHRLPSVQRLPRLGQRRQQHQDVGQQEKGLHSQLRRAQVHSQRAEVQPGRQLDSVVRRRRHRQDLGPAGRARPQGVRGARWTRHLRPVPPPRVPARERRQRSLCADLRPGDVRRRVERKGRRFRAVLVLPFGRRRRVRRPNGLHEGAGLGTYACARHLVR